MIISFVIKAKKSKKETKKKKAKIVALVVLSHLPDKNNHAGATIPNRRVRHPPYSVPEPKSSILRKDELAPSGEIYVDRDRVTVYNAALTQVNLEANHNRSYRMHIVKNGDKFTFFRRWGRTGAKDDSYKASNGWMRKDDYKNEEFRSASAAIDVFKKHFFKVLRCSHCVKSQPTIFVSRMLNNLKQIINIHDVSDDESFVG